MNKYALLCTAFVSSLACLMNAECDKGCRAKELAADVVKATMRSADQADVRSCSSCCSKCGKCKTCGKCCCKSVVIEEEKEEATKSCGSCCKTCGKCCGSCSSCKSVEMDPEMRCACGKPKPKAWRMDQEEERREEDAQDA